MFPALSILSKVWWELVFFRKPELLDENNQFLLKYKKDSGE